MSQQPDVPHREKDADPLADWVIPSKPVDPAKLKKGLEEVDDRLKPFRTPVTPEVLNSIIG